MKRNKRLPTQLIGAYDVPFVAVNIVRSVSGQRALLIAVLNVGDGYLCIEYQIGIAQVVLCVVKKGSFAHFFSRTQDDLSEVTADLKSKALICGATLEAIQLLAELTPLSKEEETTMANPKLSKKPAAATAAKAPKEKKAGAVGRVAAEFDYKVVKGAKNETREGTWTRHMIEVILAHTSTAEARAANANAKGATSKGQKFSDKSLDFAWAKAQGFITF